MQFKQMSFKKAQKQDTIAEAMAKGIKKGFSGKIDVGNEDDRDIT